MQYSIVLMLSAIFTGVLTVICYRRRTVIGASTLMWIMVALTWWSAAYAIENLNTSLGWHKFWSASMYVSIAAIPVLWMYFSLQYSQQETAPSLRSISWVWIVPVLTNIMAWTNDWHHLLWPRLELVTLSGTVFLDVEHGLYFWIHAVYSYINIAIGIIIFIRQASRADQAYRQQAGLMLVAAAALLIGNTLYLFDLLPFKGLDITPFSFTISGSLLALGLFRHRLLDLMPIANEIILNNMGDGILVVDASDRVVYANPAFETLTGLQPGLAVGENIRDLLAHWPNIFRRYEQKTISEIEVEISNSKHIFELLVSPLIQRSRYEGCMYVLRDITERLDLENRLRLSLQIAQKDSADDYVFIAFEARDGKIIDVNNEFVVQTGYGREQALGRTALQLGLWDLETRTNLTRQLREKNQLVDAEIIVNVRSNQRQRWKLSVIANRIDGREIQFWIARTIQS